MKPFGLPLISAATETLSGIYISGSPRSNTMSVVSPQGKLMGTAANPSITMFQSKSRKPYPGSPFTGGGLTLPWGIAVDGDDTVWVFNFGAAKVGTSTDIATGISRFCGVTTSNCPPGLRVGDPISPDTGYRSDALERITGAEIDRQETFGLRTTGSWMPILF